MPLVEPCPTPAVCAQHTSPSDPRWDPGASAWQMEPWAEVVHEITDDGETPLWNPYAGVGSPLAANMQSAVFDPVLVGMHLDPTPLSQDITFLVCFALAGVATYAFARALRLRPLAATVAGGAFGLSGWFFTYSNNQWTHTYVFFPLSLALVEWTLRSRRRIFPALLALSLALMILAGMPEMFFICFVALGAYSIVRVLVGPSEWSFAPAVGRLAIGAAGGVALAAPVLLLFVEYLPLSQNSHDEVGNIASDPDSLVSFVNWMAPKISPSNSADYSFTRNWIGAAAMLLVVVALSDRAALRRYCSVPVLAMGVFVALPIYSGVFSDLTSSLPLWSQANWAAFGTPVLAVALVVLAATGVQALADGTPRRRNVAIGFGVLAVVVLATQLLEDRTVAVSDRVFVLGGWPLALVAVAAVVLALVFVPRHRIGLVLVIIVVAELLLLAPRGFYSERSDPYVQPTWVSYLQDNTADDRSRIFSTDGLLFPETAGVYQLQDPRMLDALYPQRYWRYLRAFVSKGIVDRFTGTGLAEAAPAVGDNPMFDLLGVRYLAYKAGSEGPPSWSDPQYRLVHSDDDVDIYENTFVTPRAFVAHDAEVVDGVDAALAYLKEGEPVRYPDGAVRVGTKDPVVKPVVELAGGEDLSLGACSGAGDRAAITAYSAGSVEVSVDSQCAGLLVLTDEFYPGWTATVNGDEQPVIATDVAFRGVAVPAGRSTVVFEYAPGRYELGVGLALAAVVLGSVALLALWWFGRGRRRRRGDDGRGASVLGPVRLGAATPRPAQPTRAVFLDRDGVLNEVAGDGRSSKPPRSIADLALAPDAPAAVQRLRDAGFLLLVVTNQPDVARGAMDITTALDVTGAVVNRLHLDDGYVCPHDNDDDCPCRKPKPGMLVTASRDWNVDLAASWLVGDRWVDVVAARGAGVRGILLETVYSWDLAGGQAPPPGTAPFARVTNLTAAVDVMLSASARGEEDPRRGERAVPEQP